MAENPAVKVMVIHRITKELFTKSDISSHSKLYGLVPCGLGTVWQESLTSYLNRLAWRHHVPPRHLVAQEIVPYLSTGYTRNQLGSFSRESALSINGNDTVAREWATILERLTMRSDLHLLTLLWWVGDLQTSRFFRIQPAWCPLCYEEWKNGNRPIYDPFMWALQVVTICRKHRRRLENHCPHCQKRQPFIKFSAQPGHCTHCNTWLGTEGSTELAEQISQEQIEWQEWVICVLEELHNGSISSGVLSWEPFFGNLAACFETRGEQSRLAEITGLARGPFACWLNRSQTPTLQSILEFCYVCNVTPSQVMMGNLTPLKQVIIEGKPHRTPRARRPFRPVDREHCLGRIQAILDGHEEPLGYVQLAEQLGYSGHSLLYHFPQECALLTKQVKELRRQQKEQRIARVQEEVRQATLAIHLQGVYPSLNKVADLLSDPNLLFMPEARSTWRTLCRELGWERHSKANLRKTYLSQAQNFG